MGNRNKEENSKVDEEVKKKKEKDEKTISEPNVS